MLRIDGFNPICLRFGDFISIPRRINCGLGFSSFIGNALLLRLFFSTGQSRILLNCR